MNRLERRDLYRLLGGLLAECPREQLCEALVADAALERLGAAVGGDVGAALTRMHTELVDGPDAWKEVRSDFTRLFVGPRKKLAPPWESVYRSPARLVMQEHEREVVRAYAEQRVGFEGMGGVPADHVALELQFCAWLLDHPKPATRAALRRFLAEHLLTWVPLFAADVERQAKTELWRAAARALTGLCAHETESVPSRKRMPVVAAST